jgi:hypothetical protein
MINNIIINIENLENLSNIIISIDDLEPIILTENYLKIYNEICYKIIHKLENGHLIIFNLIHLLSILEKKINDIKVRPYIGFPIIDNIIKINWICVSSVNPEKITLKLDMIILDEKERKLIKDDIVSRKKKINNLECYQIQKNNETFWNLDFMKFYPCGIIGCVMSNQDYDLLASIEIMIGLKKIFISKNVIEIFHIFYDNIIFTYKEFKIIKIKYLSKYDGYLDHMVYYNLKMNFVQNYIPTNSNIYQFQNINDISVENCLALGTCDCAHFFTNGYSEHEYYLNGLIGENISNMANMANMANITNIEPKQINLTHIKEIFIFFTNIQTNQKEKIVSKFKITIADITNEYSDLDMEIYSRLHHNNIGNLIYNIGYSLNYSHSYPNGLFNLSDKPVKIEYFINEDKIMTNYKINIIFFGYKVHANLDVE